MKGRSGIAAICLLCALAASSIAAQGAMAEPTGTTAFTCRSNPGLGTFSDAHCKTGASLGNYAHIAIEPGETTELSGTNASTCEETGKSCPFKLKVTLAGVATEVEAKGLSFSGSINNALSGEEHQTVGTGTLTLEEVSVPSPAGKSCVVKGGQVVTNLLKVTTVGTGMFLKLEPNEGTQLGAVTIEKCVITALNQTYPLAGSIKGVPAGATVGFTEAEGTSQNTLKFGGQKAGLEGQITLSGRTNSGQSFTPLAFTTPGEGGGDGLFKATEYPALLNGNQAVQHSFAAGTKEIECTEAAFPGTLSDRSPTVAIFPEYKSCRTELNLPTTATMNGCSYVLHRVGKTSISCPAGKKIQFHVFESEKKHLANEALCTYSIPPQGPIGEVVYEPEGSGSTADLLIKYNVTGISYEVEGPKLQCGSSASNGEYTGSSTETAKNGKGEQIGLFVK
ncbi:MAG TPA: hypothetical protein VFJ57_14620 [Solirubrobacterales bacterium]|nr:hypothetical protein [Solirubrobacterales bacterium]